jgi:hypothetical protein
VHPFLEQLRAASGELDFCKHLEAVVLAAPDALAVEFKHVVHHAALVSRDHGA